MGLGYIFSRNWLIEILIDANFLSWACLFSFFVSGKTGFLIAFFATWGAALMLGVWIYEKKKRNGK